MTAAEVALRRRRPPVVGDVANLDPELRAARADWPVALVSMPFATPHMPSIQIGLLQAIASSHGFPVDTFHLSLELAQRIGVEPYAELCGLMRPMIGEWLFSVEAFGVDAPDVEGALLRTESPLLDGFFERTGTDQTWLSEVREERIPAYLDDMVALVDWGRYEVIGCSSTFQQNTPSIALARRIKERWPDTRIVFGGANLDGVMGPELLRGVPSIDFAVSGEADRAFPELLMALRDGRDPYSVPGVLRPGSDGPATADTEPFEELDALPVPEYAEYFDRAEALELLPVGQARDVPIPFESARGCWWGERRHCTFCGLNGSTMRYRSKSPERVLGELGELARRYGSMNFVAVDNILDLDYLSAVLEPLAQQGTDFRFFYEVKANLDRAQVRQLAEGGVRSIQPGIESLSTHTLSLMRKGVRAIQNVNLLRWTRYYGIEVAWNVLWGFPGETPKDPAIQAELAPLLHHLEPPKHGGRIAIPRFSPLFEDRERFPVDALHPEPSHGFVYPTSFDVTRVAYTFDADLVGALPDEAYDLLRDRLRDWVTAWEREVRPSLTFWSAPGLTQVEDARDPESAGTYTFRDELAALYVACSDGPTTTGQLKTSLGLEHPVEEIEWALDEFCKRGLMMRDGGLFLSLALPATPGR